MASLDVQQIAQMEVAVKLREAAGLIRSAGEAAAYAWPDEDVYTEIFALAEPIDKWPSEHI